MAPKKKVLALKMESVETEERMMYEEELDVLRNIIEDQKKELTALKNEAGEEHIKHEETVQNLKKTIEVIENDKTIMIEEEKLKFKELTDRHKHFVDKLKDKIECPVCLEVPRAGPVLACLNGHFVCNKCKTESCPTCRIRMGNGQSLLAITVIENIDHKCKFDGCDNYFTVDKLDDHAKGCVHRTVSCPECIENVALSKLVNHLIGTCCLGSTPTMVENSLTQLSFTLIVETLNGIYYFSLVMFSSEDECSKYKIEMTVHDRDSTCQDAEVSFRFCGTPCSIDEENEKLKNHGLMVNRDGLGKILRKSSSSDKLEFRLTFTIKKKC